MKYMIVGYRSQELYDSMAGKPGPIPPISSEEVEAMGARPDATLLHIQAAVTDAEV